MKMSKKKIIYIFRRDLRLTDNRTLIKVVNMAEEILPVFIYDHNQIKSDHASSKFLVAQEEGLCDLGASIEKMKGRLCKFYGTPYKVVQFLIENWKPDAVAFNLDYSAYSKKRDREIAAICKQYGVDLVVDHDVMMGNVPFDKLFHIYSKKIITMKFDVIKFPPLCKFVNTRFAIEKLNVASGKSVVPINRNWALDRVRRFCENPQALFKDTGVAGTMISAHLKLGLLSAREVYNYAFLKSSGHLVKQMIWREFYFALARENRNHYDFYDARFKFMQWINDPAEIKAMWRGQTGYPLIDASMNELNKTGFMWNRGRLLVGFFSVKILRINPFLPPNPDIHKWYMGGQYYFSKHLIDACYANNTGNWHWVASDEVDASGQRFGKGWSGRPNNVEKIHGPTSPWQPGDKEYLEKWTSTKQAKILVKWEDRWAEWCNLTS